MPRTCTVCTHGERSEIDAALLAKTGYRDIARQYGVSKDALFRHREHIPAHIAKAKEAEEIADAGTLLEELQRLRPRALARLDRAEDAGDLRTALAAIREARTTVETLLEVAGELDRSSSQNVLISPEWMQIESVILTTLEPYPDARYALAAALAAIDTGIPS